jgi:hypothetical protein
MHFDACLLLHAMHMSDIDKIFIDKLVEQYLELHDYTQLRLLSLRIYFWKTFVVKNKFTKKEWKQQLK